MARISQRSQILIQNVSVGLLLVCSTLLLPSCGKGKPIPGIENFKTSVISQNLFLSFVSTQLHWDAGLTVPIPGLKNSTISVAPDLSSSGTVFQLSIALNTLLDGVSTHHEVGGFPDGRALPDVAKGVLPRWDADIRGLKLSAYLSEDAFGLFVPLKLISPKGAVLDLMVSVAITDEKGNLLGKAYAIPASTLSTSQVSSGIFVLIPFINGQTTASNF